MDILDLPVLQIEQQSSQLEFQIADETGRPVGTARQLSGPKPRKGLLAMFGSGVQDARIVVQVGELDGTPLFYVDRLGDRVAVVAPDGTVLGRFVPDPVGAAGRASPALAHRLVDAYDRPLCQVHWTLRTVGTHENRRWTPVAGSCTDMRGQQLAQVDVREATFKDRYTLRLHYRLPEPTRTLVVASPLAFDLTRS